ncbi:MAG: molybdopterin-dependent oxidoreductase, partial [Candidatus Eisenbacteria bacterium]
GTVWPKSEEEEKVLGAALAGQAGMEDIGECDTLLLLCADPCQEVPLAGLEVVRAVKSGCRVFSAGPRRPSPAGRPVEWFAQTPWEAASFLRAVSMEMAGSAVGEARDTRAARDAEPARAPVPGREAVLGVADALAGSSKLGIITGRDVFRSSLGYALLASVLRISAHRHLLGGKPTFPLTFFGEGNMRGVMETWPRQVKSLSELVEAARTGRLRLLYVVGCDPLSEYPDRKAAKEAFEKLDLLVVQSETLNETARVADLYLPLQHISERDGTFLSVDGKLHGLSPQRSDAGSRSLVFSVVDSICGAVGKALRFKDEAAAHGEMRRFLGWSLKEDLRALAQGTGVRVSETPPEPSGSWVAETEIEKGACSSGLPPEHAGYPFLLLSESPGISSWLWARSVSNHRLVPREAFVEMSESDTLELGVAGGEEVELVSPQGSTRVRVREMRDVMRGVVLLPSVFCDVREGLGMAAGQPATRVKVRKSGDA